MFRAKIKGGSYSQTMESWYNMVTSSITTKTALIWNSCLKHSPVIFKSFLSSCGCESAPNASKCHISDSVDCMRANLYAYGKYTNYASILWHTIYIYICIIYIYVYNIYICIIYICIIYIYMWYPPF